MSSNRPSLPFPCRPGSTLTLLKRSFEMQSVKLIVALVALAPHLALADPIQPTSQDPVLLPQPPLEKKIVLEGDWRETGQAKLVFVGEEESSKVETVQLQTKVSGETWFAAMECEGDESLNPGRVSFRVQKALLDSARGFAGWKISDGEQAVSAGVETTVFGQDKLRLGRETYLTTNEQPTTEMEYESPPLFQTKVGLRGSRQGSTSEIEGLLKQESGMGWEWGAGWKAQLNHGEGMTDLLTRPELQGNLRWTW